MTKRPLSLTIIAWVLLILTVLGIVGIVTIGKNAAMLDMLAKTGTSINTYRAQGAAGSLVNLAVVYGIFKGEPWSRVLYVAWGIVSIALTAILTPMVSALVLGVVILLVIGFFLFSMRANEYFAARGLALRREED